MDHIPQVHAQSLLPSPYTLHADWRPPQGTSPVPMKPQMLEIATVGVLPRMICAQQHQCLSQTLDETSAMLTESACRILQCKADDQVRVSPITLYRAQVFSDSTLSPEHTLPTGIVSAALASLLHLDVKNSPEVVLCPKNYINGQSNLHFRILGVKETSEDKASIDPQQSPPSAIWMHPALITFLGLTDREEVSLYPAVPADTSTTVRILEHPGFCYLSQHGMAAFSVQEGDVVELRASHQRKVYVQLHASLEKDSETPTLYLDHVLATALNIRENPRLEVRKVQANLYWISKLRVDEVQNKARRVVGLSQTTVDQFGYYRGEDIFLYHKEKSLSVAVEPVTNVLPEGSAVVTSLVLRQGQLVSGQGVFFSSNHAPHMQVNVGILNVEEVEYACAKGSEHLASVFPMPCWVELSNPEKGTSLDILLERDPYPRKKPLIRLSRTTRQMLLVERGQPVLIKALPQPVISRSPVSILTRAVKRVWYYMLVLLINRRSIYVSVAPAHTWDDHAQVARIDGEALTVLGIDSGDRVKITYRGKSISRAILTRDADYQDPVQTPGADDAPYNHVPVQFQIGLDALARYKLAEGQMDFGCIVEIERDMAFLLLKSLNLALLPIIGTVLAVLAFLAGRPLLLQLLVALILAGFFFYLALSVERSKVV